MPWGDLDTLQHPLYLQVVEQALALAGDATIEHFLLGLNWSVAGVRWPDQAVSAGVCFSPLSPPRNLSWPGTLMGTRAKAVIPWVHHWDACESVVGSMIANAVINRDDNPLLPSAKSITSTHAPHLSVFEYFAPQLNGARVAIIGRYPGIDVYREQFDFVTIERTPGNDDLPESAATYILPRADWVFITASSFANKTLPQLLALSQQAKVVLMGPSLPWLACWQEYGVDYLAGVKVNNAGRLRQIACEAGGTTIFHDAVEYQLLALGEL